MNVELLRKIAAVIQEKPAEFDMDSFNQKNHNCGTPHCLGGWAAVFSGSKTLSGAQEALGIDDDQWALLCYPDQWPVDFYDESSSIPWCDIAPADAAARIEHFIATEGQE